MWNKCGKPRSSALHRVRLYTKKKKNVFQNTLKKHQASCISKLLERAVSNPNFVWRTFKKTDINQFCHSDVISMGDWHDNFSCEFGPSVY